MEAGLDPICQLYPKVATDLLNLHEFVVMLHILFFRLKKNKNKKLYEAILAAHDLHVGGADLVNSHRNYILI